VKKIIGQIHLWLGLTSGLVVFIVALTGCIYVFEEEIQGLCLSYQSAEVQDKAYLPPSVLKTNTEKLLRGKKINSVQYREKGKSVYAYAYGENPKYYYQVYLNPYSGEILKVTENDTFFGVIVELHTSLMLGDVGGYIVDYATLVFIVLLISGMVLWWPRSKGRQKSSFKIKWGASFKRVNYDLHNVLGFYISWILIFVAITGLAWGFEWMDKDIYWTATGGEPYKE